MSKSAIFKCAIAAAAMAMPSLTLAQSSMLSEVLGQPIQVTTNGVTNTLYLDAGGGLRIMTPGGNMVQGTWQLNGNQLCLNVGGQQECVPYDSPFLAGDPRTMTSSCNVVTVWTAQANNAPPTPAKSERGK